MDILEPLQRCKQSDNSVGAMLWWRAEGPGRDNNGCVLL